MSNSSSSSSSSVPSNPSSDSSSSSSSSSTPKSPSEMTLYEQIVASVDLILHPKELTYEEKVDRYLKAQNRQTERELELSSKDPETFLEKLKRKSLEEPYVPVGCLVVTSFLVKGLRSFRQGDVVRAQHMMRGRVIAQFITIGAMMVAAGAKVMENINDLKSGAYLEKPSTPVSVESTDASGVVAASTVTFPSRPEEKKEKSSEEIVQEFLKKKNIDKKF